MKRSTEMPIIEIKPKGPILEKSDWTVHIEPGVAFFPAPIGRLRRFWRWLRNRQ